MSNLLAVDWDYFFGNPMEAGNVKDPTFWMYDWGHRETPFFIEGEYIWGDRAAGFERHGIELPTVDVPADWWKQFKIDPQATLYVADSNAWGGRVRNPEGDSFDNVVLYDAHHDLFGIESRDQLDAFEESGEYTCEDWMFRHYLEGSSLHWRYPQWQTRGPDIADKLPKWIDLDHMYGDVEAPDDTFDTVFLCRSGAWVPPWCDDQFAAFMAEAPVADVVQLDEYALNRSDGWKKTMAAAQAAYKTYTDLEATRT